MLRESCCCCLMIEWIEWIEEGEGGRVMEKAMEREMGMAMKRRVNVFQVVVVVVVVVVVDDDDS